MASGLAEALANRAWTHDIVIDGNTFRGNGTIDNPRYGVEISGRTTLQYVSNNVFDGNTSIGIYVRGGASGISITGNTVNNSLRAPTNDVAYRAGFGILLANVGGNTVTGNTGSGNEGRGVCDWNPTSSNTIHSNTVAGSGTCP